MKNRVKYRVFQESTYSFDIYVWNEPEQIWKYWRSTMTRRGALSWVRKLQSALDSDLLDGARQVGSKIGLVSEGSARPGLVGDCECRRQGSLT